MDKGKAMTGTARALQASLALVLLSGFAAGCATHTAQRTPEVIPAQVCGGDIDSDGDGVRECQDRCPGTLRGEAVGADGCPLPILEAKPYRG
jgi:OOP family OmpA-OmpF porin